MKCLSQFAGTAQTTEKNSDYEVTFTWQQDGEHHSVTKDSIHKGNRRNDGRALAHLE
ncbi:hypothetical protein AB4251_26095 [Vibrio lentus]|uniref:hypothetical protein n=1 Tax=Vibrio lentus TaxID=136468 RepID=UPI0012FFE5B2|nr:hypothetical protein [Vibrio lentus]MCC4839680.1 hypothetical protein [Vibrio lentus]